MTDDQLDNLAERLAQQAMAACDDPADAAGVLIQAGTAVALTQYPLEAAIDALNSIVVNARKGLAAFNGVGETRQ